MGNKRRPDRQWNETHPKPTADRKPGDGGGVAIDYAPPPSWTIVLRDLTPAAGKLRPGVAVRGERSEPRFRVYAGKELIGFVPPSTSAEIRAAMEGGGTGLLGRVVQVDLAAGKVMVELSLEGR